MFRITRKVFSDLSIWMIGLGLMMGIVFPFFVAWMGIPVRYVFTPIFFIACITAGIIVGSLNITLARSVVGSRMTILADRMQYVTKKFQLIKIGRNIGDCTPEECMVIVDSEDEIGLSAKAFNNLVETLFESIETEESIKEFTQLLGTQMSLPDLAQKALGQLMSHTESAAGAIIIENDGELKVASSQGIRDVDSIVESEHVKSVFRTEKPRKLTMPEDVQIEAVLAEFRPQQVVIEPIFYKDVMLGAIILASACNYSVNALNRLGLFVQNLALALHNTLLFDRLERLAALDPLTGTYNRRFGMTRLHEEFGRSLRMEGPLGLMMIDLDHFKDINDVYGHLTGDRVLLRLAKVIRSVMRDGDILIRYGGEEFLAILPGASRKDLFEIADRLRRKVSETAIGDGEDVIKATVSVGCVSYPENEVANDIELVRYADTALYNAKESGRNCVMMASLG